MIKQFKLQRLFVAMAAAGVVSISSSVQAGSFQLFEQDAASIGNYHAGAASEANDASTAFYNPAGLVRIHNQQFIAGVNPVFTDFKFNGTVDNTTSLFLPPLSGPQPVHAQGGNTGFLPFLYYAAPITDKVVFGFNVVAPFGLKTDYGHQTFARYAATKSALSVVVVSPSLGVAVTDKLSLGAGFDFEHLESELDLIGGLEDPSFDSTVNNVGKSNAYGYHLGALYQCSENTRIGIAYHSQMVHHLRGSSNFEGPLHGFPDDISDGLLQSTQLKANVTLPPTTMVSIFHTINPTWDVMASIAFTQWQTLDQLILLNNAGISTDDEAASNITVVIPQHYRNSWTYSAGANYHVNEQFLVRTGIGFDETPSRDAYRNLQLPDSDRIVLALGGHYQATSALGIDVGWEHIFEMNTRIYNLTQAVGAQITTTNGSVRGSGDIYGAQVKWDIA